jgi:hypothetical protein
MVRGDGHGLETEDDRRGSPGTFALPDLRTVLVDADPCRPRRHEVMGPANADGLLEADRAGRPGDREHVSR